jgi:hypothetical protein
VYRQELATGDHFGEKRAHKLRTKLVGLRPHQREQVILESLSESLREMGANFVMPFRFRERRGQQNNSPPRFHD